jgi:AcrR family transcriptional regulator
MNNDKKDVWIQAGYALFAEQGPMALKIEVLAKMVGISKSSFYHYFADLEVFTELLLAHHLVQARKMEQKELNCANIDPDLISILLEHKTDLFFNRQLRVHRQNPLYAQCLVKSNEIVGLGFIEVWTKDLNLKLPKNTLLGIFELALENFYLQITPDTLTEAWLSAYFKNLSRIVANFNP